MLTIWKPSFDRPPDVQAIPLVVISGQSLGTGSPLACVVAIDDPSLAFTNRCISFRRRIMSGPNAINDKSRHVPKHRRWLSILFPPREPARAGRKPPEIAYGVDDVPPPLVMWISALQQAGSAAMSLVIPLV